MVPSPISPVRSSKRALILREAAGLFRERGFGGTSMRELAGRVGVEAASMYNHIRSKDELLETLCMQVAEAYLTRLREVEQHDGSALAKIRLLLRHHIHLMVADAAAVSVANNEWKHLPSDALARFKEARRTYERGFAALIEAGIGAGELRPVNVSVALFTLLSAVRWVELWYRPERPITPAELEETISTLLLNGLQEAASV